MKQAIHNQKKSTIVQPLIMIVGETASGKSTLAIQLAEQISGEIICADSRTVYKGMDIGTAKPTAADRLNIPHYLLDVVKPNESFNASQFKELALIYIEDISSRGKIPIIVGGTGLYVDSLIYDYDFRSPADPLERQRLSQLDVDQLQQEITEKSFRMPENAQNKRHLTRLLEANGVEDIKKPMRENTIILGLEIHRNNLRERIIRRTAEMIDEGLELEVRELVQKYGWDAEGMNGIGYREWHGYLSGTQSMDDTAKEIIIDTMNLAKRQRTWFRRNSRIQWLTDRSIAVEIITTFLNK